MNKKLFQYLINYLFAIAFSLSIIFIITSRIPAANSLYDVVSIDAGKNTNNITDFFYSIINFNLGISALYRSDVLTLIISPILYTLLLIISAVIISVIFSLILGVESGWYTKEKIDSTSSALLSLLMGIPEIIIALIVMYIFAVSLKMLPSTSVLITEQNLSIPNILKIVILPLLSLTLSLLPGNFFLIKNNVIINKKKNYTLYAEAKGFTKIWIRYRYVGVNSLSPLFIKLYTQIGTLMLSTVSIEYVFSYPGIGTLLINAVENRDIVLARGIIIVISIITITITFISKITLNRYFPHIKYDI